MTPAVREAIEQIKITFEKVALREDGDGGAFIIVEDVELGEPYLQSETWMGFHVTFQYPYSDVYPHFARGDLGRRDGHALGEGMSQGHAFEGRQAVQISRKSNHIDPALDTAILKLLKVLEWLRSR